jgi:membrane protease YdiL (CAAX protease family)
MKQSSLKIVSTVATTTKLVPVEHKQPVPELHKEPQVTAASTVPWAPIIGVVWVLLVYVMSQIVGSILVYVIASVLGIFRGVHYATSWSENSILAQFLYVLFAEAFTVGAIYFFLKKFYKRSFASIEFHRPRWRDPLFGLMTLPFYFITYAIIFSVVSSHVHSFNATEKQQVGFTSTHGVAQLVLTGISLVILPPIAEEIMVRGLLYTSLKKWVPRLAAVLLTSALFASAHLPEGGGAGLLWNAALDTFVLSLFLIFLREVTKNLWSSMTLHGLKNGIAYYVLYISPLVSPYLQSHFR